MADDESSGDEALTSEEASAAPARPAAAPAWRGLLSARPADEAAKSAINRINDRERLASFAAVAVAAIAQLAIWIPQLHTKAGKGQPSPPTSLALGLILAGALLVATLSRRRALVGFVALFIGLGAGWNRYPILQLPFLALAAWLIMTSFKVSQEAAKARRAAEGGGGGPARRERSADGPARGASRSGGAAGANDAGGRSASTRRPPEANKRYTPPAPKRRRPGKTAPTS